LYHLLHLLVFIHVFTAYISESDFIVRGVLVGITTRASSDSVLQVILDS